MASSSADRQRGRIRSLALTAFAGYVLWNGWWLAHGQIPPSLLLALFGLPCPTTGGTRSFTCLWQGDLGGSLFWNPCLIPILLLLLASFSYLALAAMRRRSMILPRALGHLWLFTLGIAWIVKLVQGPQAW